MESRVNPGVPQLAEDAINHRDAFQGIVLALDRHEQSFHGGKGIQRQNSERGRAINQHDFKTPTGNHGIQDQAQPLKMILPARNLHVRPAKIDLTGNDLQILEGSRPDFAHQFFFAEQRPIRTRSLGFFETDPARRVGLRVQVQQKDFFSDRREAGRQINGGGRFAHSPFLIRHRDDSCCHEVDLAPRPRETKAEFDARCTPGPKHWRRLLHGARLITFAAGMKEILVIGHKNPDTDAICSAIGYAEFKRQTGLKNAVAARCGDTNDRIDFVLKTFGVPAPRFVSDVSPKIRDVMASKVVSVSPEATVAEALALLEDRNIRSLPVLDADHTCRGLLSLYKMSRFFFPVLNRLLDTRRVVATLRNLAKALNARTLFAVKPDVEEDLILMVGAMRLESFAKRLPHYPRERLLVVVGDREEIQRLAIKERVRAVVVTGGLKVEKAVLAEARRNEVSMLLSPHDSATTAMLCRAAITVMHMVHEKFLTFREDQLLSETKAMAATSQFQSFPVLDHHRRMVGILSKSDFLKKVERQLILVDHNELSQAVRGADTVQILEVIDHHRIGTLSTAQPILFRNEPVGSTSTIVADCFFRADLDIPRPIAGLLLAGVVSDTLNLTSPTTTERDVAVLMRLQKLTGVDATEFTEKLFASGSLLISKPAEQAITTDCKEYVEQGKTFSVAQIEEIGFDQFWKRKKEVLSALNAYRQEKKYYFSCLLVTDVVNQNSVLAIAGDEKFLKHIDYPELEDGLYELNEVVSRKKQLLPFLAHCLEKTL